jgi:hypothetical protein
MSTRQDENDHYYYMCATKIATGEVHCTKSESEVKLLDRIEEYKNMTTFSLSKKGADRLIYKDLDYSGGNAMAILKVASVVAGVSQQYGYTEKGEDAMLRAKLGTSNYSIYRK